MPGQCPLNAANVDRKPKPLRHALRQFGRTQFRLGLQRLQNEDQNIVRQLVCALGPLGLGQQPGQPFGLEAFAELIQSHARESEGRGRDPDRLSCYAPNSVEGKGWIE
jgi:hypothetical protein